MLNKIRRLVYRLGLRPRPGTIFYSPSLHVIALGEAMSKAITEGFEKAYREGKNRPLIILPDWTPEKDLSRAAKMVREEWEKRMPSNEELDDNQRRELWKEYVEAEQRYLATPDDNTSLQEIYEDLEKRYRELKAAEDTTTSAMPVYPPSMNLNPPESLQKAPTAPSEPNWEDILEKLQTTMRTMEETVTKALKEFSKQSKKTTEMIEKISSRMV